MATLKQQLTSALRRLPNPFSAPTAKPKPSRAKSARAKPARAKAATAKPTVAASKKAKEKTRHDLGKAQLSWYPWERLGAGRFVRYATGLNGDIEGTTAIKLFAEREGSLWIWSVVADKYSDLVPRKFKGGLEGNAPTEDSAKLFAEKAVGLS